MTAELTARPDGATRHPWDWYVEQEWVTHRLLDFAPIAPGVTMLDPCAGGGSVIRALRDRGHSAFAMDLFDRGAPHFLGTHDFLGGQRTLLEATGGLSIIFNPPFSFQNGRIVRGLAERFIRRALEISTHQVAALLPLKWLASGSRFRLFTDEATAPIGTWILTERPSMPPGDQIKALGKNAWRRGKIDYVWIVWDKRQRPLIDAAGDPFVPTYWIPPRKVEVAKAEELNLAA